MELGVNEQLAFQARYNSEYMKKRKKFYTLALTLLLVVTAGIGAFVFKKNETKTPVITTETSVIDPEKGTITQGKNIQASKSILQTNSMLEYESPHIELKNTNSTAAILKWQQSEGEGVGLELRTFDGKEWSNWIESEDSGEEGKDGAPVQHSAIILSKDIHRVQYRFKLAGNQSEQSAAVNLGEASLETVDTSKGPTVQKRDTIWEKLTSAFKGPSAQARSGGPMVHSRLAWGSPEAYGTPDWEPEYEPLSKIVVHHTATTATADSAAAVRAIWHYHARSLGWGDIGYNYLVDRNGNIFQGRYYDHQYASENNVDVVAGHVYGHNYGSSGIAVLGDFTNENPTLGIIHSVGDIAAFKGGAYGLNPGSGANLVGHRDLGQTACPGARLYPQLDSIRSVANALYPRYKSEPYAWKYMDQAAYKDEARTIPLSSTDNLAVGQALYFTLLAKNIGIRTWTNDGDNPVRLGTSNAQDRSSQICDPESWVGCARAAVLEEASVAPGQTGTFNFKIIVPANNNVGQDRVFYEYFNLLSEGKAWFNDPGLHWGINVKKPYAWKYMDQAAYTDSNLQNPIDLNNTQVSSGQTVYLKLVARNMGSKTWTSSGSSPVRIGTSNPQDRQSGLCSNGWISCSRAAAVQSSTAPGADGTFVVRVVVPNNNTGQVQTYKEYFNLMSEGVVWMADPGLFWVVKVSP